MTPSQALEHLKQGNRRFTEQRRILPRQADEHLRGLADNGQKPIATILGCSDSRAPIEHLFDAGFGELFVQRVAGNILGDLGAGTIQYAVDVLEVPLIVVLGHSGCGAVAAALSKLEVEGPLADLIARVDTGGHTDPEAAVQQNVRTSVARIREEVPGVAAAEKEGRLIVTGAVLQIESGVVDWFDD